jgi:uncharacterized protein involved in type VI secretion and phage assembly
VFASKQVFHQRLLRADCLQTRSAVRRDAARPRGIALELPLKTFHGTSSARHLAAGSSFSLTQHDHYRGSDNQFKVLQVTHAGAKNLPAKVV